MRASPAEVQCPWLLKAEGILLLLSITERTNEAAY